MMINFCQNFVLCFIRKIFLVQHFCATYMVVFGRCQPMASSKAYQCIHNLMHKQFISLLFIVCNFISTVDSVNNESDRDMATIQEPLLYQDYTN